MVVNSLKRVGRKNQRGKMKYAVGSVHILKAMGKSARESIYVEGFALNCTKASQQMPSHILKAKIALLDFGVEKTSLQHGYSFDFKDTSETVGLHQREKDLLKERLNLIIKGGANVILTSRGMDDLAAKYLVEAGALGVKRVAKDDLDKIARATGGTVLLSLANFEGGESFDPSCLGEAESVSQEPISDQDLILIKGTKNIDSASIILRGANTMMLDEMERSLHDALCAVKRCPRISRGSPRWCFRRNCCLCTFGNFCKIIRK